MPLSPFVVRVACPVCLGVWACCAGAQPPAGQGADTRPAQEIPIPASLGSNDPMIVEDVRAAIEAVEEAQRDPDAWDGLASHYFTYSYWSEAAASYRRLAQLEPLTAKEAYRLAFATYELGEVEEALRWARTASELEPTYAPASWRAGFWEFERGRIHEAEAIFERTIEMAPASRPAWAGLARVMLHRREGSAAEAIIREHLLVGPNAPYGHQLLATALRLQGKLEEAAEAMRRGGGVPRWSDPWLEELIARRTGYKAEKSRADALIRAKRYAEAERILEGLLERFPGNPDLLNNLAVARFSGGDVEGGIELWERCLELDPGDARAHLNLGRNLARLVQARRARPEEALEHLDEAIRLNPAYGDAWVARGTFLYGLGRLDEAEASLRRAIQIQPRGVPGNWYLALIARQRGDWDAAVERFNIVAEVLPTDPRTRMMLADTHIKAGDLDAAEALIDEGEALGAFPGRVRALREEIRRGRASQPGDG